MQEPARRTDSASIVAAAEPGDVYRAFSDPAALLQWLPPGDMTGRVLEYDFREGGRYRIELTYAATEPAKIARHHHRGERPARHQQGRP